MRFVNLRIKSRFYLGFGALIVLAVAVAVLPIRQLHLVQSQIVVMTMAEQQTARINEIALRLEAVRRSILHFANDGDQMAVNTARQDLTLIGDTLNQQALDAPSVTQKQAYASLASDLQGYIGQFSHLVQLNHDLSALLTKSSTVDDKIADDTKSLLEAARATGNPQMTVSAGAVEHAIARLRLDDAGFQKNAHSSWGPTIQLDHQEVTAALGNLDQVADPAIRSLVTAISANLTVLKQYLEAEINARSESIKLYYGSMIPTIIALKDDVENKIRTDPEFLQIHSIATNQAFLNGFAQSTRLQVAVAVIKLLLSVALAAIFSRSFMTPLIRMTHTMTSLANGDTSIEIPSRDKRSEIGDMARAIEVFKLNKIRADNLASQQVRANAHKAARQAEMDQTSQVFGQSIEKVMHTLMESASAMYHAAGEMTAA
jgi:methyl-accepting chemotaxis protein